jgi:hypothetical protein
VPGQRIYNASDPYDRAWASEVYETAVQFIQTYLLNAPSFSAYVREMCDEFERRNPALCDDDIVRPGTTTQTEWRHRVDAALQSLKGQGIIIGGRTSPQAGLWRLA